MKNSICGFEGYVEDTLYLGNGPGLSWLERRPVTAGGRGFESHPGRL